MANYQLFCTFAADMQRYFIFFGYDGTNYHGWQIQPHCVSVQEVLQRALEVVGAGRTDAGVHARMMAAHFDFEEELDVVQLARKLNRLLPRDIAVDRVERVANDIHARFSATSRTYHYYIHTRKIPFLRSYSWETHYALDFDAMNMAAAAVLEYEDFGAFCKSHTDVKTTLCHITEARWIQTGDTEWYFVITASRFLRNVVRAVVGTLIEVGRGRMTMDEFRHVVEGKKRTEAGESMPAHALFLENVSYDG